MLLLYGQELCGIIGKPYYFGGRQRRQFVDVRRVKNGDSLLLLVRKPYGNQTNDRHDPHPHVESCARVDGHARFH